MNEKDIQLMCEMNMLVNVTTPRQRKNGTYSFVDKFMMSGSGHTSEYHTNVYDVCTRTGYIQKSRCTVNQDGKILNRKRFSMYPINPRDTKNMERSMLKRMLKRCNSTYTTYADIRDMGSEQSILRSMLSYMNYSIFITRKNSGKLN